GHGRVPAEEVDNLRVREPFHASPKIRRSEGPEPETIPLQNPAGFQHEVPTRSRCVKTFARPCRPSNRLGRAAQLGPDDALKSTPRFPSYVIVYDPRFLDHVPSPLHVERPDRLRSIVERLEREGLFHGVETPPTATIADLRRVHRGSYVELVRSLGEGFLDPETAVLYVSTHEYGIYPGTGPAEDTGTGEGRGFTVNIPFTAGCGDASYVAALDSVIEPILGQFRPDVVLVSLGIDAHYRDPLTSLTLSSPGYVDLVKRSAALAARLCANRFTIALEGGYHLEALSEVIAGVVAGIEGRSIPLALTDVLDDKGRGREAIEATKRAHRDFWNLR